MSPGTMGRLLVTALVLLLGGLLVAACGRAEAAPDEYREQVQALEVAWEQGVMARTSLEHKGQTPNSATCTAMYNATVASRFRWDDDKFKARGQGYFVAGCIGRGMPGSSFATTTTLQPV